MNNNNVLYSTIDDNNESSSIIFNSNHHITSGGNNHMFLGGLGQDDLSLQLITKKMMGSDRSIRNLEIQ